ncbi:hypothetical protein D3C71_2096880 [compost metagenome]
MTVTVSRIKARAAPSGQFALFSISVTIIGAIIRKDGPPRSTGVAYAFIVRMKDRTEAARRPGMICGKRTSMKLCNGDAPRLAEA